MSVFLRIFYIQDCVVYRDSFTSFLNYTPFISFYCLIALAGTSSEVLNRSSDSRHSVLVPDHSFQLLIMKLLVVGIYRHPSLG